MPTPLFIIGNQRSGTTWLANILCQHSKIVGVQGEPFGIIESRFFNCVEGYFGTLKNQDNFIQFIETYAKSDYFRLTGIDKDLFYKQRPTTYVQFFRLLMDTFTDNNNATYWLEKSPGHTLFLKKLSAYFKNAKFISIKRNTIDIIKSAVRRRSIRNNFVKNYFILLRVLQHVKYNKYLDNFNSHKDQILIINYNDLRNNPQFTLTKVCEFLGLKFESTLLEQRYKPNTSFSEFNKHKERDTILTSFEIKLIKVLLRIFKLLPYKFYQIHYFFQIHTRKRKLPW